MSAINAIAAAGNVTSSSDISEQYMTMLITQLKNQNPLEPMTTEGMATALSQLAQLGQLEKIGGSFEGMETSMTDLRGDFGKVLKATQVLHGQGLIGKNISFTLDAAPPFPVEGEPGWRGDITAEEVVYRAEVEATDLTGDGVRLVVGKVTAIDLKKRYDNVTATVNNAVKLEDVKYIE